MAMLAAVADHLDATGNYATAAKADELLRKLAQTDESALNPQSTEQLYPKVSDPGFAPRLRQFIEQAWYGAMDAHITLRESTEPIQLAADDKAELQREIAEIEKYLVSVKQKIGV